MKQRILFVDDEQVVLRLYQAIFREMSNEYEMEFTTSPKEALVMFRLNPFDIVVSDVRMPEMNGADFLHEIMRLYPRTIRIMLSGYADQELVLRCVGIAHQYLMKPCEIKEFRSTLRRLCELDLRLRNKQLQQMVAGLSNLPSLPSLYLRILEELESPTASAEGIGDIIAKDLAMTPKLLQLVNSAFFGIPHHVAKPSEAVQILGVGTVRTLVLAVHVFSSFKQAANNPIFQIDQLWQHSLTTGTIARRIAQAENCEEEIQETAYTAGLLHDAGKLILAAHEVPGYRETVTAANSRQQPLWQVERDSLGASHAEVGAYLFGLWGLPASLVEAVAWHYRPGESFCTKFGPLTAVHVANALEENRENGFTTGVPAPLDMEHLEKLGLTKRLPLWREIAAKTQGS